MDFDDLAGKGGGSFRMHTARIGIENARFRAAHGYYPEEHKTENEFSVDLFVETNISMAARQDDLIGTVNYGTLYLLVQTEMRKPVQLIETLASRIMARVESHFPGIAGVRLVIRKLNPPLGGEVSAAVIELTSGSFSGGGGGGGLGFRGR